MCHFCLNISQSRQKRRTPAIFLNHYLDCFAEDAIVLDEDQKRYGKAAIKKWSDENQFAVNVRLEPKQIKQDSNEIIITFKLDGDYDKSRLPDPLLLDFRFNIKDDKIIGLSIY